MKAYLLTITPADGEPGTTAAATRELALDWAEEYAREHWADAGLNPIEPLDLQEIILDAYFEESGARYSIEELHLHGWEHEVAALIAARFPTPGPFDVGLRDWQHELSTACMCPRGEGKHHPNCPAWDGHADNVDENMESCPKCGKAVPRAKAFEDQGEGAEAGRTFYYCSERCRESH